MLIQSVNIHRRKSEARQEANMRFPVKGPGGFQVGPHAMPTIRCYPAMASGGHASEVQDT